MDKINHSKTESTTEFKTEDLNEELKDTNNDDKSTNNLSNNNEQNQIDEEIDEEELEWKLKEEKETKLTDEQLNERLEKSINLKEEGNKYFKNQEFDKSLELYNYSLEECPIKFKETRSIILSNRAACKWKCLIEKSNDNLDFKDEKIKLEFDNILNDLTKSIKLNSNYFRPYLKRAELNHRFGGDRLDNSLADYMKAKELTNNQTLLNNINYEIIKLQNEIEQRNEKLKQEMFGQLKNLGNLFLNPFGLSTDNFKLQPNENGGYSINFQQN